MNANVMTNVVMPSYLEANQHKYGKYEGIRFSEMGRKSSIG